MNDAHIYCTLEQVESEFVAIMQMYDRYYQHLRLGNFRVRLSLHDTNSDKFVANEELWNRSEDMSRQVLNNLGIPYEEEKESGFLRT
jgi:threonyl-tRNA synthetase